MPSITIIEIPNQRTGSGRSYQVSPNPTPQDMAILMPEHSFRSKWKSLEPVHRSLTVISALRSKLGIENSWYGPLEVCGLFDTKPTVSAAVWISDWINYSLAHVRVPGGGRHMFAMFLKDRLNDAARVVVRKNGLGLMGPSACWNIGQKLSMLPNGELDETLVFHNVVERGNRHWEAVMALRYTISAAMHQWLLERRAAGLPAVTVEPETR